MKNMEKLVAKCLSKFLEDNNFINENQHGFGKSHFTLLELPKHCNQVDKAFEQGKSFGYDNA